MVTAVYVVLFLSAVAFHALAAEDVNVDVIIIGAGMAGIAAGRTLTEMGITNFVILEATDRVGGRIRNTDFAGMKVEMGANWVEGVNGKELNPVWDLAKQVNLRTILTDTSNLSSNVYDASGALPPQIQAQAMATAQNEYVNSLSATLTANNDDDVSVLTAQRLFGSVASTPVEMALDYQLYDGEFAEPPRVTSLKNTQPLPTFENFGEDSYFAADPRGFATIIQPVASYLKNTNGTIEDPRLMLNKVVNKIAYGDWGVSVSTEDGATYTAKAAIATVSLGVLQSKLINFEPDLPFWKLEAIFEFNMAIYTKIFLKFPSKFWRTDPGTEFFLYADDSRGYYPVWQHLEREFPGSNIIFVTVTDDESRRIEQQSDNQTLSEIMDVLRKMYGPTIPMAEEILIPRWWSNRFFKGTFSNWPIGVTSREFAELQAPIDRLYFAGEHTSADYNGYIHGAYFTGIDAAKSVATCLKQGQCVSGSTKQKNKTKGKKLMEASVCAAPIKEELDAQRQHWVKKVKLVEEALAAKCA
ncbi:hypothetical protein AXG93_1988s1270 [Marchantia polymorpha subsp. ruderalis]|uniref:Amine oxidase domain-containing protein n=1 Tax=Marchantia polymorpha subsp. ruderalis TaxID=1480154 RepID=A0A176VX22_MARPO|nr:hypothetical protein AXG93_1988s1270 [Marchantia polymorpha subsp. ruderalis]